MSAGGLEPLPTGGAQVASISRERKVDAGTKQANHCEHRCATCQHPCQEIKGPESPCCWQREEREGEVLGRSRERPWGLWCQGLPGWEPGDLLHAATASAAVRPRVCSSRGLRKSSPRRPPLLSQPPWESVITGIRVPVPQASGVSQEKRLVRVVQMGHLKLRLKGPSHTFSSR